MEQPLAIVTGLRELLPNGSLWFPPFGARDYNSQIHQQEYRCVASNPAGVVVSRHSSLSTVMAGYAHTLTAYSVNVEVGNTGLLNCGGGRDYVHIEGWLRDSEQLHTSGRLLITTAGDLHIKNVSKDDAIYQYRCKYRNMITGENSLSNPATLIVTDPQGSHLARPDTPNSAFRVASGGSIDLPCIGQGYPQPAYSWYKLNEVTGVKEVLSATPSLFPRATVLSIVGARSADSGRYICRIHNQINQFTVEHQLQVTTPLSTRVLPSYLVTEYGETARLNCSVEGFPVLNVFWLKNGEMVMPSTRIRLTPSSLTISNVDSGDGGMYQCLAVNEDEESQAGAQMVLGSLPPVFKFTFGTQTLQQGPAVSLRCDVSGSPPPTITWYLDHQEISLSSSSPLPFKKSTAFMERLLIGQYLTSGGIVVSHLNISAAYSSDGGLYRCEARNSIGSIQHSARLNVYGPPMSRGRINKTAVSGGDVLLVCPVSGYPIHRVEWAIMDHIIKGERPAALSNGSLLIRAVEKKDGRLYTCTAYSEGQGSATAHVVLLVLESPKISPFAFDGDLKEGDRSQVSCTISSGDLPIAIHWRKNGLLLDGAKLRDVEIQSNPFSSSIFFFSLKAEDSGSYMCLAENSADVSNFSAQLIVKVSPYWKLEPLNQTVLYGSNVVINCQAAGNPRPTISWRKALGHGLTYEYVQTSDGNLAFHPNGSLVIKSVRQSDEGFYRCEVQNGVGEMSKEIFIDVQVPVYFDVRLVNRTAIVNQDAALICNPYGDQPVTIEWRIKDKTITKQQRFKIASAESPDGVMNTLAIRNVTRGDGVEYTCVASNRFGSQSLTVFLQVFEPPEPPSSLYVSDVSSRSITLSWYPAFDGNSPLTHYQLQYKLHSSPWRGAQNQTVSRDHSYARIVGLVPARSYQLRLSSVNTIGVGPPSRDITTTTKEEVPSGTPLGVRVEAISSTQILVSWQPPLEEERNGKLVGYNVRYGPLDTQQLTKKTLRNEVVTELMISRLLPYTKYQVIINAFNRMGGGPTTSRSIVSTKESVPWSAPESVRCEAISPSSLSITWSPPPKNAVNGIVLGYSVTYRRENLVGGKDAIKEVKSGGLSSTLQDLETFTTYYLKVAAFTKIGVGASSHKLICTTGQDVPSAPEDIKAVAVSSDTILLSWRPPAWPNGHILSYTLYTQADRKITTTTVGGTETEFNIKGLTERQHYEFWAIARTAIGSGGKSKVTSGSPTASAPAKISTFSASLQQIFGGSVTLPCRAFGSPSPKVEWVYKGTSIKQDNDFKILADGSLVIRELAHYIQSITCQAENKHGSDRIHYSIDVISPPAAPSIRITRITSNSIGISWHLPHNGGALIQGYVLNLKSVGSEWQEISLDYDLVDYTIEELPCGSTFSFNLIAHNIAGRSKPSATLTSPTQGSIPSLPDLATMISVNMTSIVLHLYGWGDGGCPIHYYVVEYREVTLNTWRVLSSNIRSEEEDVLISDLSPATRYVVQLTAHNTAGNRIVTGHVSTLTLTGETLLPWHSSTPPSLPVDVDGSLAIPIILSLMIVSTALLLSLYCFKRRRLAGYPGYSPGIPQYSAKSCSENTLGNVDLYTPLTLQRIREADSSLSVQKGSDNSSSRYDCVPYAVYRSPNVRVADKSMEYSTHFQTFGHTGTLPPSFSGTLPPSFSATTDVNRTPDSIKSFARTPDTTRTVLSRPISAISSSYRPISAVSSSSRPISAVSSRSPPDGLSLEISCISQQDHLPVSTIHLQDTRNIKRFSLYSETDSNDDETISKFATLRRSRRYSSREVCELVSDSSTESGVERLKQQARANRRSRKAKQTRRCRSHSSLEDLGQSLSVVTRLSTDSRELTEPECDRGIPEFRKLIKPHQSDSRKQKYFPNITKRHNSSKFREISVEKLPENHLEEKFVIKV